MDTRVQGDGDVLETVGRIRRHPVGEGFEDRLRPTSETHEKVVDTPGPAVLLHSSPFQGER